MQFSFKFNFSLFLLVFLSSVSSAQTTSWTGIVSTGWNDASNWTNGIPTSTTDAIIGDANFTGGNQPSITRTSVAKSLTVGGTVACTLTVNKGLNVAGDITITGNGRLTHGRATITLSGNWSNSGTYISGNNRSTVTFAGISQSITGSNVSTFRRLRINTGATVTLNRNTTVSGTQSSVAISGTLNPGSFTLTANNLTLNSGATLKVLAATFAANYVLSGTTTIAAGSNVDYAGTTQTVTDALTYSTLTISGSGVKTLAGNLPALISTTAAVGNIYVTAGTLDLSTFTANRGAAVAGGALTVFNGATLKIGGTNTMPTNYATKTFSLTSTVEYSGTTQTVSAESYGNLTLSSSGGSVTKTMPATAFTVYNNFNSTIGAGTGVSFTSGNSISFLGNVTLGASTTFNGSSHTHTISGSLVNSGTFTGSTGTIILAGSGATVSGAGTYNFNNLSVTGSGIVINGATNITVTGNLETTGAGTLTHSSGGTLTMSGTTKTISGNNLILDNLTVSGTVTCSSIYTLTGNLSVSGTFSASSGVLTMSGSSKTISGAGTIVLNSLNVTGTVVASTSFSIGSGLTVSGTFSASSGTATFTGTSSLNGTANLNNVTVNGTSLTLATNSSLGIASTLTLSSGTLDVTTATPNIVNFNGSGAQNVNAITYNNLTISNSNTKTASGGITVNGDFLINSGPTFAAGAFTHTLLGNFTSTGTFSAGTSTFQLTGSQNVSINGNPTFNVLTVNKSSNTNRVTLSSNASVASLTMTQGNMFTGSNAITITSTRTGNGIILGNITRTHVFSGSTAYAFEGPENTITISGANSVSSITVSVTLGAIADFPFGGSISRLYDIAMTGSLDASTATLRLHYEDDELNGNGEAGLEPWKFNGSWTQNTKTGNNTTTNYVELNGISALTGRWTLSEDDNVVTWNGSVSSDWNVLANWTIEQGTPSRPPSSSDIVQLGTSVFTNQPTISSAVQVMSIIFGSAQAVTLTVSSGSLTTSGNINGIWSGNATHNIAVGANSLVVGGDLSLSDGVANHNINLTLSSGTVTVSGSLYEAGGANITLSSSGTLIIGKDFNYVNGTFTPSTGTVVYNGNNSQTIAEIGYNNLTINKSSGISSLGSTATVAGNLLVSSGQLDLNANLTVTGTVTVSSGATINSNSSTLFIGGNLSNSGTFVPGLGTVEFNGTGAQSISAGTFNNVTVNKASGTASLLGNITINGNLSVTNGTFDLTTFTANRSLLGGSLSLSASTAISVAGANNFPTNYSSYSLNANSTTTYNGTISQSVRGNLTYGNLVFSNGGSNAKTLTGTIGVAGNLTINSGATFDASTFTLNLSGNWTNAGTFTPSSSTVNLNGSSKTIDGTTSFSSLNINGSYSVINSSQINVTTTVIITSGGSFESGSGVYTIDGDFIVYGTYSGSGVITYTGLKQQRGAVYAGSNFNSTGTFNFNGSVAPLFTSTTNPTFTNVNINNTGGINASVPWLVLGNFTIGNGASFNGGIHTHTFGSNFTNNGTITSSGTIYFNPNSAAAIQLNGTTFSSSGTVNFGGTGQISITGTFNTLTNLILSNTHASGITPPSGWTAAGNLVIANGATLNAGSFNHSVAGNFESDGTLNGGTSTYTLSGDREISGSPTTVFNNLTVTGTRTANSRFYVSGNFVNNGTLDVTQAEIIFTGTGNSTISGSTNPSTLGQIGIEKTNASVTMGININGIEDFQIRRGTFSTSTFTLSELSGNGAMRIASGATLILGGTNTLPTFTLGYIIDTNSTVNYAGTTQTVSAASPYGNLEISTAGGNKTAAAALTILGNFTLSNGTFVGGNFTHSIAKNWTMSGGTFTNTNTTIQLNGTIAQTVSSTGAFNNLTINKASNLTSLASDITVAGTLTLTNGVVDAGSNTLIVSGTGTGAIVRTNGWVMGNLRRGIAGTGNNVAYSFPIGDANNYSPVSITFASLSGPGTLTTKATNTDHPDITNSTLNSTSSVNRYYTLTNNSTLFTTYNATFTFVAGDLDGSVSTSNLKVARLSGGNWSLPTTSGTTATTATASGLTGFGDFIIAEQLTKIWDGGAATLNWNDGANWNPDGVPTSVNLVTIGANSGTVIVNTAAEAKNLTLNNISGFGIQLSSGNSLTVTDTLTLTSANIDINGQTLTLNGTLSSSGTGSITGSNTSNLTIVGSGNFGSLRMNQSSNGTTNRLNNLTINRISAGAVSLNDTLQIIGVLTMTAGTLTTNGKLVLTASSHTAYGQLSGTGAGSVSGSVKVVKVMANNNAGWRQIGLPAQTAIGNVSGLKTQNLTNNSNASQRNVFRWNSALDGIFAFGWEAVDSADNNTYGYNIYSNNSYPALHGISSTISVYGSLIQNNYTINIPYTRDVNGPNDNPDEYGWNLIPNRFASNIDISDLIGDGDFQTGYKAVHIWDYLNNQYVGINSSALINYNNNNNLPTTTNIAPWQAFWVKADGGGQSITVKNTHRTTNMTDVIVFMKTAPDFMRLNVKDEKGRIDQVAVMFDFEATRGFDGDKDMYKLRSFNMDVPTLLIKEGKYELSANALPYDDSISVQLDFISRFNGENYSFQSFLDNLKFSGEVWLEDKKTGGFIDLRKSDYNFKHDKDYSNRFVLHFYGKTSSVNPEKLNKNLITYSSSGNINIKPNIGNKPCTLTITNILGQVLFTENISNDDQISFRPINGVPQVYFITLWSAEGKVTVRHYHDPAY